MDLLNVAPPFESLAIALELVPEADLAEVFKHDVAAFDVSIR